MQKVIQHLMGFLKNHLSSEDKACRDRLELLGLIEDYRQGLVPLIVPLPLLKHHLGCCPVPEWVHHQVYLNLYPMELMLRHLGCPSSLPHATHVLLALTTIIAIYMILT